MQPHTIPLLYSMLASYALACSLMEHFAITPGWAVVPTQSLPKLHEVQSDGIVAIYVGPKIALTAFTLVLLVFPNLQATEHFIPGWVLGWSAVMLGVSWIVSFGLQFPLQRRIREGGREVIGRLARNDLLRVGAMGGIFVAVIIGVVF